MLILSMLAFAADPAPIVKRPLIELARTFCKTTHERARQGDSDWLNREMQKSGWSEDNQNAMRTYCLFYLAGREDEAKERAGK